MIRYCAHCEKEFDVNIKSMEQLEDIRCPFCDRHVDKNSRPPQNKSENEAAESFVGRLYYKFLRFRFLLYPVCGVIGVGAYLLQLNTLLYTLTLITMLIFLTQYRLSSYRMLWPIAGAACGYYFFRNTEAVCAGIMAAWIVRHIWRLLWLHVIVKLINIGR